MVRKPVGTAADLPKIVAAGTLNNFDFEFVDNELDRRIRPFRIELRHELIGSVLYDCKCICQLSTDFSFGNPPLKLRDFRS